MIRISGPLQVGLEVEHIMHTDRYLSIYYLSIYYPGTSSTAFVGLVSET